jgi:hypothetical protein
LLFGNGAGTKNAHFSLKAGALDDVVTPLDQEYLERRLWFKITTMLL